MHTISAAANPAANISRIHDHHARHGHKRRQPGQQLGANLRVVFGDVKDALDQSKFSLAKSESLQGARRRAVNGRNESVAGQFSIAALIGDVAVSKRIQRPEAHFSFQIKLSRPYTIRATPCVSDPEAFTLSIALRVAGRLGHHHC